MDSNTTHKRMPRNRWSLHSSIPLSIPEQYEDEEEEDDEDDDDGDKYHGDSNYMFRV